VCSVEPGTPDDVTTIVNSAFLLIRFVILLMFRPIQVQQVSRARVPFAVKGGGHYQPWLFVNLRGSHLDDPVQ
jgi:hypothetical protein